MLKKNIMLIMAILLLIPTVSAFTATIDPVNSTSNRIYYDEVAEYKVVVTNTETINMVFSMNVNPVEWVLESDSSFLVNAGETEEIIMRVKPRPSNFKGAGTYFIPVTIKSSYNEIYSKELPLYIRSFKDAYGDYLPTVSLTTSIDAEISPKDGAKVRVFLRNRNILDIKDLKITIEAEDFQKEEFLDLDGLNELDLEYSFTLDPKATPGSKIMRVIASYNDKSLSEARATYEIIPYSTIDRERTESSSWFKTTKITILTNNGNVVKSVNTELDSPWYVWLFSSLEVEAKEVEKTSGIWSITLDPQDKAIVTVTENYRYPLGALLLAIIILILYFIFRSPITIQKQIVVTGKDAEGISEMKVRLFVTNRTSKAVYNLRLIDKAPSIATVLEGGSALGVVQPSKIIPTDKKGTIIKWDVETIDAFEERIFTYTLKARLKIIGNVSLPMAKAKFETVAGDERTCESAKAFVGAKV
ncbi:MAG: hypothetical protein PHU51_04030 [Candidatus Nanoarchaeia archaeon]|nr:hypothetical protein [Candidatus Nanoarchaeia archaeon]